MPSGGTVVTDVSTGGPLLPETEGAPGGWRRYALAAGFLAPAAVLLGIWVVYPTIRTIIRSFFDRDGSSFVWFDNYRSIFTSDILVTAVKNNLLWVAIVPAVVAAIGLIFAVLMERVSWAVAFRTAVFMPMAISAFAAGITWRLVYIDDPNLGVANAAIKSAKGVFSPAGVLPQASPSTPALAKQGGGMVLKPPLEAGSVAQLGLTAIPPDDLLSSAKQAVVPDAVQGGVAGVVWRDFKPGGGTPGQVESEEVGIPGVHLDLRDSSGKKVGAATSADDGTFRFDGVGGGRYTVAIAPSTFAKPFGGVEWLGPSLVTPAVMIAYIWIWAGFAMVVLAAGLAAIPRDVLEAARTDGASELQVFRRVTVPLLAPVLTVVFVTMLINVLKVFDIVISIAPGSSQDDANVLALAMWRTAFGGNNDFGVGSAIAVLIFLLVIPILMLNVRRFRREA
jgi:alpha-glucoside transport system permease protein